MQNIDLVSFVVRSADGSLDHEATLEKFAEAVATWEVASVEREAGILSALNALFDAHPGQRLKMDFICSKVLPALGATAETWTDTEEVVHGFIKSSPAFHTRIGRGGGTARVSDMTGEDRVKYGV